MTFKPRQIGTDGFLREVLFDGQHWIFRLRGRGHTSTWVFDSAQGVENYIEEYHPNEVAGDGRATKPVYWVRDIPGDKIDLKTGGASDAGV